MTSLRLLLPTLLLCASSWASDTLTIMTDERHPLAWQEKGMGRGIAYDLVAATMKELGLKQPIVFTSFNRGLKLAQTGNNQVFFSTTRSPDRLHTLKWVGPLVHNDIYIYKLKDSALDIRTQEDLRKLDGIGVPKGMSQDTYLTEMGLRNIMRSDTLANVLRAMVNKRVTVVAMGQLTARSTMRELELDPDLIEETPLKLYDNPVYIAFSPDVSNDAIARWQKALDKVRKEKYKQLFDIYIR